MILERWTKANLVYWFQFFQISILMKNTVYWCNKLNFALLLKPPTRPEFKYCLNQVSIFLTGSLLSVNRWHWPIKLNKNKSNGIDLDVYLSKKPICRKCREYWKFQVSIGFFFDQWTILKIWLNSNKTEYSSSVFLLKTFKIHPTRCKRRLYRIFS